jgi:hypothetical protein
MEMMKLLLLKEDSPAVDNSWGYARPGCPVVDVSAAVARNPTSRFHKAAKVC